jgi:adenosylcobinamide-GDP ribazoletransferase
MRRLAAAITMLTILPIPGFSAAEADLERSKPFFPVVGLIVGGIAYAAALLLNNYASQTVAAVMLVILLTAFSKGFHLDGLADSADGFMSSRSKEKMLEIMRDSRIGAMGVFAILAVLGLKTAALVSLPPAMLPSAVLLAALSGRCSIVIYIYFSRYARETGLGLVMFKRQSLLTCLWSLAVMTAAAYWLFGVNGLYASAGILIFICTWRSYVNSKIGGATGDTIGAAEEISEMLIPLILSVCCR